MALRQPSDERTFVDQFAVCEDDSVNVIRISAVIDTKVSIDTLVQ